MPWLGIATIPWHLFKQHHVANTTHTHARCSSYRFTRWLISIAAEWTNEDGLAKTHRVKVGYEYNDEELAIHRGERQDDGSYVYVSPKGRVHTCPAEKASIYDKSQAEQQQRYQAWKDAMGGKDQTVDCEVV